jgi:hydroxymethylglutaryl-CoA lyase
VREIAVFTAASESFNQRNINATISQSFDRIEPVIAEALKHKIKVRGYVSTAFGCPYEGYIDPAVVLSVSQKLRDLGCYEISLGDTIGSATPFSVEDVLTRFDKVDDLALHFHDTRAMALTNILIGLSFGVSVYDSSSGGLGGCPYAKGATGNVATEDLVYLAQSLGIETGIDLQKQSEASEFILSTLNVQTKSKFLQAYLNGGRDIYMAKPKA